MKQAFFAVVLISLPLHAGTETSASALWNDLKLKRDKLPSVHQEFEVTSSFKTRDKTQASRHQVVLDTSEGRWREKSIDGSGTRIKIFDGKDLFSLEEGGDEYVRVRRKGKDGDPAPFLYLASEVDWSKAQEVERKPCGLGEKDHTCVVLDVRFKPWTKSTPSGEFSKLLDGTARVVADTETGCVLAMVAVRAMQNERTAYQSEVRYLLKRYNYGAPADAGLFKLPSEDLREVKELSRWDAAKIKKQLKGKPAPELTATDVTGKSVVLSSLKGKTVLLDFWTTWCPPCRADAPALDKLYNKYGEKDLAIVGVSVSEDRAIVEKFLKEHPHSFPVILTSENDMPAAYQIGVFPTYIVIDRDGTLAAAVQGDQGFGELRKLLKKAGLELD